MITAKNNFQIYLLGLVLFLISIPSLAQESTTFLDYLSSTSTLAPRKEPPYTGRQISYHKNGKLHTIIHYRKGQMVRYRDYLRNGGLFQDLGFKNGVDHGKYHMYNEVVEIVFKGKMKNGKRYSGQFDQWDPEIKEYRVLTYKNGMVIDTKRLSELPYEIKNTTD